MHVLQWSSPPYMLIFFEQVISTCECGINCFTQKLNISPNLKSKWLLYNKPYILKHNSLQKLLKVAISKICLKIDPHAYLPKGCPKTWSDHVKHNIAAHPNHTLWGSSTSHTHFISCTKYVSMKPLLLLYHLSICN